MTKYPVMRVNVLILGAVTALAVSACGGGDSAPEEKLSGPVIVDGSSTVEPLSVTAGAMFMKEYPNVRVTVGASGTGGGFKKFCAGETDISDASRPINDAEKRLCAENGVQYSAVQVANDALTVVVNKENTWATCLTVAQLKKIWEPTATVRSWREVDPSFPDEPLKLYGPDTESGTFDYFTAVINGAEGDSRKDYGPSADDNVTVAGVAGAKGGLGYFGYTYFEDNTDTLRAVEIDSGKGCVGPSVPSAQDGSYRPLARPLFIYISDRAVQKPQAEKFVEFYIDENSRIVEAARFVPMTSPQITNARAALADIKERSE